MSLGIELNSLATSETPDTNLPLIGVGLRHQHYNDALSSPAEIDFVEVHAENFFAEGGITTALLEDIQANYKVSIHATSLGLGSAQVIPKSHVNQLNSLISNVNPILVSDHACFTWGEVNNIQVHAGDLLPVPFNEESLSIMSKNIDYIQRVIDRKILVENLSAYVTPPGSTMSETEFLTRLAKNTGCKLLVDLNNLMVNAVNQQAESPLEQALSWLSEIPATIVGEFHLAGCTNVKQGDLVIDDHSQPVSNEVWTLYRAALEKFGSVPTLIEWDLELPSWSVLITEANKAKVIAKEVFKCH